MDKSDALLALAALAQPTRLDAFRLLVRAGREGMVAGQIAEALDVRQNTMSANLSALHHAGLVRNAREGRSIRYTVDFEGMRGLFSYLLQDCCGGRQALCQPLIDEICSAC